MNAKIWSVAVWADRKPARYRRADEVPTKVVWFYAPIVNGIVRSSSPVGPFATETEAQAAAEEASASQADLQSTADALRACTGATQVTYSDRGITVTSKAVR